MLTGADMRAAGRWTLDRDPYLLETSVPGIFACGDVRFGPVKRVAAAVGEGSMAIAFVHQYLRGGRRADDSGAARGLDGMSSVRCQMSISLDGYVAGPNRGPVDVRHRTGSGRARAVKVVGSPTVTHVRYRVVH